MKIFRAFGSIKVGEISRGLYRRYSTHAISGSAAELSYYFVFSLFPFLVFVAALVAYLPLEAPVRQSLERVRTMVPAPAMVLIEAPIRDLLSRQRPQILTFGLLGSFWSASRGVDAMRRALNLACGVRESRPWWKTELVCSGMTFAGGLGVLVAVTALVAGGGVGLWLANELGARWAFFSITRWLRWPMLGGIFMITTGLLYRFLPDVALPFRFVAPGAAVGTLAWILVTWTFGKYVGAFGHYDVTYGALGGVIVLLTWVYLAAFITIAGGELNAVLRRAQSGTLVAKVGE